jgi:hypothetical protein
MILIRLVNSIIDKITTTINNECGSICFEKSSSNDLS